jgi:transcriptional regulator with XRE-family HTH domain
MVNTDDFVKRLEKMFQYYSLSASSFADKIGVQRSSLSHLLSGRNKPSLDFILKIIDVFPEVDLYWILNGKGNFPKTDKIEIPKTENGFAPISSNLKKENLFSDIPSISENAIFEKNNFENQNTALSSITKHDSKIEKIVILYSDGTFSEYKPK